MQRIRGFTGVLKKKFGKEILDEKDIEEIEIEIARLNSRRGLETFVRKRTNQILISFS